MITNKIPKEEGFTLVELLVVIGIMGTLFAIVLPLFIGQQRDAALSTVKSDIKNTSTNAMTYVSSHPTATQTDLQNEVDFVLSQDNQITITGNAENFFVCGETRFGDNWAYSSLLGVMDDCTLGQAPPVP